MQSTSCLGQTVSENLKDYRVAGTDIDIVKNFENSLRTLSLFLILLGSFTIIDNFVGASQCELLLKMFLIIPRCLVYIHTFLLLYAVGKLTM